MGTNKCHCGSCHATFSVVSNFDKHRDHGKCVPPESVGLAKNKRGIWMMPGEIDYDERFNR